LSQNKNASIILETNEFQPGIEKISHFSCSFKTVSGRSLLKLSFISDFGSFEMTPNGGIIDSFDQKTYSPNQAPIHGNFEIFIPWNHSLPTNYSSYEYSIESSVLGENKRIGTCKLENATLHCPIDSFVNSTTRKKLYLFINNMKAFSLSPYFSFYENLIFLSVYPSTFIQKLTSGFLYLNTSSTLNFLGSNFKAKYSKNNQTYDETCTIVGNKDIKCPYPSFNETGSIVMSISQSDVFETLNSPLQVYDVISNFILSSSTLSYSSQTLLYIHGSNFISTNVIKVKIFDGVIEMIHQGVFLNSTTIHVLIDPFYLNNVVFPRYMAVSLSLDGGLSFVSSQQKMFVNDFKNVKFSKSVISKDDISKGIQLLNFPMNGLYFNSSTYSIDYYIHHNDSFKVKMNCLVSQQTLTCDLLNQPPVIGDYYLKIYLTDISTGVKHDVYISSSNSIYVYSFAIWSIQPKTFILNSKNVINITGNWNLDIFKYVKFRFKYSSTTLFSDVIPSDLLSGTIETNSLTVTPIIKKQNVLAMIVEVTFNEINYHPLAFNQSLCKFKLILIQVKYKITDVSNVDGLENYFLTYSSSIAKITGENFINAGDDLRIVLKTPIHTFDISSSSQWNLTSSTEIYFKFPNISEIAIDYELKFPFKFNVGLSLSGGYYYEYSPVNYLSACKTIILIYLVPQPIFSAVFPTITPRQDFNLTIYGIKLKFVSNCTFHLNDEDNTIVYEVEAFDLDLIGNTIKCPVPKSIQNQSILQISLKNTKGEKNLNYKSITFYGKFI
jgi:hypothetical protein